MELSLAEHLCAACNLGSLQKPPQAVSGGLLHHMWHITTTHGDFALKQLNPAIIRKPGMNERYRQTEHIAAAFATHGIPAIAALTRKGDSLVHYGDETFLIYPWIDGATLAPGPTGLQQARLIGKALARIHQLNLSFPEMPPLTWKYFEDEDWDMLTFQAADQDLPWAYPVRSMLPRIWELAHAYEKAGETLLQTLVVSHRDLDQKNVIWRNATTPCLIDWEAAGFINPTMELAGLALDWSGQAVDKICKETFTAVLEGYTQAGGIICDPGLTALYGFLGTRLGWLLFNMRRSLGESIANEEERQLGTREVTTSLAGLHSMMAHIESWAFWIDRWR